MGFYSEKILPYGIDWCMRGKSFQEIRIKYLKEVHGIVLEVGFGSGLNLPHYQNEIKEFFALDPSIVGRRLAQKRITKFPSTIKFVNWTQDAIDLPDNLVDSLVTTWTLCTIPNPSQALQEFKRVLKPDGVYYFIEHGQSPNKSVARIQNLWNPIQKKFAGGCHVNRNMENLITDSGFHLEELDKFYMEGPKMFTYLYCGKANQKSRPNA